MLIPKTSTAEINNRADSAQPCLISLDTLNSSETHPIQTTNNSIQYISVIQLMNILQNQFVQTTVNKVEF